MEGRWFEGLFDYILQNVKTWNIHSNFLTEALILPPFIHNKSFRTEALREILVEGP